MKSVQKWGSENCKYRQFNLKKTASKDRARELDGGKLGLKGGYWYFYRMGKTKECFSPQIYCFYYSKIENVLTVVGKDSEGGKVKYREHNDNRRHKVPGYGEIGFSAWVKKKKKLAWNRRPSDRKKEKMKGAVTVKFTGGWWQVVRVLVW